MRILYVAPRYFPSIGGAELWTREIVRRVAKKHTSAVIAQWRDNSADYVEATTLRAPLHSYDDEDEGAQIHVIAPKQPERHLLASLAKYYARYRLIHPLFYTLYRRALLPQVIAQASGFDLVHSVHIGLVYMDQIALDCAHHLGVPFVFTPFSHQGGWAGERFRKVYREADAILAMTEIEKSWLVEQGAKAERVHVCPAGPLLAEDSQGKEFRQRNRLSGPVVLFVGQKLRYKGYQELLAAMPLVWAKHPDCRFVFVGPKTEESERIFAAQNDQRVLELGAVDLQTKTDALACCDLLCVPSMQESLGLVFLEAWAMGKPVIGGDIPIEREIVDSGRDGLLVQQDPTTIAEAIMLLLGNQAAAQLMGKRGQDKVRDRYNWDVVSAKVEALYGQLVQPKGTVRKGS